MFDLNRQIEAWKKGFAKSACTSDELEELECHLREEIAASVAMGRAEEQAFHESVARLGDPAAVSGEFAKNERPPRMDSVVIRAGSVLVCLVGLAAVASGLVVWMQRQDGVLGAHQASILFAYVVPFLLAVLGAYAILRAAMVPSMVPSGDADFCGRLAAHTRRLYVLIAIACATGAILGGIWAQNNWGRFWGWDVKEIGALCVASCALVLFALVTRFRPSSVHLGQACLIMSLVTFAAWFGPAVYSETVGQFAITLLAICLVAQLAILSFSLFVPNQSLAEN
jgi:ABC-type transport system involved in cytochrome c biogenesis permease subunit